MRRLVAPGPRVPTLTSGDVGAAGAVEHVAQARLGQQHVAHGGRGGEGGGGEVVALRAQRLGDARGGLVHVDLGAAADPAQERHDGEAGQVAAAQGAHAPVQRPAPADAQGLAGAQPVGEPGAECDAQGRGQVRRVLRGGHDHGLLERRSGVLQPALQGDAGGQPAVDLDLDQAGLAADLQVADHLDPADAEPVGDLGLGQALDIVEPGDPGAALLVGREQVEHGGERGRSSSGERGRASRPSALAGRELREPARLGGEVEEAVAVAQLVGTADRAPVEGGVHAQLGGGQRGAGRTASRARSRRPAA